MGVEAHKAASLTLLHPNSTQTKEKVSLVKIFLTKLLYIRRRRTRPKVTLEALMVVLLTGVEMRHLTRVIAEGTC